MIDPLNPSSDRGGLRLRVDLEDSPEAMDGLAAALEAAGGRLRSLVALCEHAELGLVEIELTIDGLDAPRACDALARFPCIRRVAVIGEAHAFFERRGAVVTGRAGWTAARAMR